MSRIRVLTLLAPLLEEAPPGPDDAADGARLRQAVEAVLARLHQQRIAAQVEQRAGASARQRGGRVRGGRLWRVRGRGFRFDFHFRFLVACAQARFGSCGPRLGACRV